MSLTSTQIAFSRAWAMPSADTFTVAPIAALLDRWLEGREVVIDPFARNSKRGTITNDLNPQTDAQHHKRAVEFLLGLPVHTADAALIDPPYSPRQIKDCYQHIGMPVNQCTTQHAKLIADAKDAIVPVLRPGGIAITCGWNSQGMGKGRGFELLEILLVAHGASHNDTIVVVERKVPSC